MPVAGGHSRDRHAGGQIMRFLNQALSLSLNVYLHRLPRFRGKWRLLGLAGRLVDGVPVRSRFDDVLLRLDTGDRTNRYCVLGTYGVVPGEIARLREGDCLIDVGANCGLFSLMAARRVGAAGLVLAFEPSQGNFGRLVANLQVNPRIAALGNVLPFRLAIGPDSELTLLDVSPAGHSGRYSVRRDSVRHAGNGAAVERIAALSTCDFPALRKLVGDRPTVIKIDVEGFELAALQGLAALLERPQTQRVVVEIDERNLTRYGARADQVYAFLHDHGFAPAHDRGAAVHFDAVFARPDQLAVEAPADMPADIVPLHPARATSPSPASPAWRRIAAVLAAGALGGAVYAGWGSLGFGRLDARSQLVPDATMSHKVALLRSRYRDPGESGIIDAAEAQSATRAVVPDLPREWRVTDAQIFPSDEGPSMQVMVVDGRGQALSIFAVRARTDAPADPAVMEYAGQSVAYWQEGDLAYALTGDVPEAELGQMAEALADVAHAAPHQPVRSRNLPPHGPS